MYFIWKAKQIHHTIPPLQQHTFHEPKQSISIDLEAIDHLTLLAKTVHENFTAKSAWFVGGREERDAWSLKSAMAAMASVSRQEP
ncbi:hypothetical protein V6N13_075878 [Hibiscus sabdariffa]